MRLVHLVLVVGSCLVLPLAQRAHAADSLSLSGAPKVLDPATLNVLTDSGTAVSVRMIGIAPYAADDHACGATQAVARMDELLAGQTVHIETLQQPDDEPDPAAAYVWLDDGQNLGQLLVREGSLPAASTEAHPLHDAFAAAQAAAIADRVGIWAPGACLPRSGDAVDRGGVGAYVTSATFAVQRAQLAAGILREQSRSAPLVGSTPNWQTTTTTSIASLRQAVQAFEAPATGGGPASPVHDELVQLGHDLQTQTDAYASASGTGDIGQLQTTGAQLIQTADALLPILAELNAIGSAYGFGD